MGISMGTISFGDYLSQEGIHAFLVDMRGYGMSSILEEQVKETYDDIKKPLSHLDLHSDIMCAVQYIKTKIKDPEISIVGFSFAGTLCVSFANQYPNVFKNLILLNTSWKKYTIDPVGYSIITKEQMLSTSPYNEITMKQIENRLITAQPDNKNFIESMWYDEASKELMRCHQTYNKQTDSWKIGKIKLDKEFYKKVGILSNIKQRVLLLSAQYDIENPYYISSRLYRDLSFAKRYIKIIPNATHLCIWEKQRHLVYELTAELVK
jgi:pimeloyl-ACP methyl ester carboxylesterase